MYTADPSQLADKTFDFVVVGGGTAGLAVARRLAEWPNMTVAVIEAGGDGTDVQDQITIPGMSYLNGLAGTAYDWAYTTTAQNSAAGGTRKWPRGKGVGGSSATNGGFWCHGSQSEYDAWRNLQNGTAGAHVWGWDGVQEMTKKAETWTPMAQGNATTFQVTNDPTAHGTSGPIQTSYSSFQFPLLSTWVPTVVASGLASALDPANGNNVGVSFVPSIINPANGSRSDSNFGYAIPFPGTNLVILTGYQVTKINWNSTTSPAVADGVSFAAGAGDQERIVHVSKEVIISGGSVNSPQILQLSGVGPKSLLENFGINSVFDLPGVGANLQDHLSATISVQSADQNTWAALKQQPLYDTELAQWHSSGTGMWTYWNEAIAYPSTMELFGKDQALWAGTVDISKALSTSVAASQMDPTVQAGVQVQYEILDDWAKSGGIGQIELIFNMLGSSLGGLEFQFCLQHPFSRGYIRILSNSSWDAPEINPNYLSISYDADIMLAAFRFVRKIISTSPLKDQIISETEPGSNTQSDQDVNNYIANSSVTEFYPIGTNSMLPFEWGGVVNTTLVVYGTANVRVVDASVIPLHIAAHTMSPTYAIAERAAEFIKAQYAAPPVPAPSDTPSASNSANNSNSNNADGSTGKKAGSTSNLSTGTKIAIGAGSAVGAVALIVVLFLLRFHGHLWTKRTRGNRMTP
ncbi:hypothetical protein C8J57DRAFT_1259668 [Mycena rebaudengoi]|nr:hypothetical protein C8J57DRAFT_1259668 [Mycena rebaudengoi]